MKAVLMAGGEGSRLRPMTSTAPKPLIPVADRPIMEHVLRLLRRHGLTETVITTHYLADQVESAFGDGAGLGMELRYAREPEPLGTAGSVKNAQAQLGGEPFLVISGDALTDIDLTALIRYHREQGALVTVALARVPDPVEFGVAVVDDQGRIERFLEKPTWAQVFSDTVNTGIYVMEPEVLDLVAEGKVVDWSADVFPKLLAEGRGVYGYVAEGYWEDVGTHESYLAAQADVLAYRVESERDGYQVAPGVWVAADAEVDPGALLRGPLYIGPRARIGAGARVLEYSVVGAGSVVEPGAELHRAVLHPNAYVGRRARLRGCVVGRNVTVHEDVRIGEGVVVGDGAVLRERSALADRVLVYPGRTVEAGTELNRSLIWLERATRSAFGARGVAGPPGVDLTPERAVQLAGAFAALLPRRATVVLARDHSRAARVLSPAVLSALLAGGLNVRQLGCVPAPLARLTTSGGADGGILVTAEPGDPDSVSLVFLDADGFDLSQSGQRGLDRILGRREYRRTAAGEFGEVDRTPAPLEGYAATLVKRLGGRGTDGVRPKVVVDAAHGTGTLSLPQVLGRLEVDALLVNCGLDEGRPTETAAERLAALHELGTVVRAAGAEFGVRLDALGERFWLVDEQGRPVPEDQQLLLMVRLTAAGYGGGRVVLPATVSRLAERDAARHGAQVHWVTTAPGELGRAAVAADVVLAGDGRGGFTVPRFSPHADGVAAFAQLAALLAEAGQPVSELVAALPRAHVRQRELPTAWETKGLVMRSVVEAAGTRRIDTTDGVRVIEEDGRWALVLPDPTEAVTRLWAEGPDGETADALLDEWTRTIRRSAA
ncbi:sugar phosphate nucleotidyltransferase [Kitasatospora gansuensis]